MACKLCLFFVKLAPLSLIHEFGDEKHQGSTYNIEVVCETSGLRVEAFVLCGAVEEGLEATGDGGRGGGYTVASWQLGQRGH